MSFEHTSASQRQFLPPAVAVSTVAFSLHPPKEAHLAESTQQNPERVALWIPLVRRTRPPFDGEWALPGGPIPWDEALTDTALRTLHSAVHRPPSYLEQLYSFGARERSAQAQRLVTIAYWALYGEHNLALPPTEPHAVTPTRSAPARWDDPPVPSQPSAPTAELGADPNVSWFSAEHLPELAFDHAAIVATALTRLRSKTEYAAVAHRFLGPTFTLAQLREVHEAVLDTTVDPANFRRQMLSQRHLVDTGETTTGTGHRPARLYRFADDQSATPTPSDSAPQRTLS